MKLTKRQRQELEALAEMPRSTHNHRCDGVQRAIDMELFEENLLNPSMVFVRQPKKLLDGTKGNRLVLINNCPFCGAAMVTKVEK